MAVAKWWKVDFHTHTPASTCFRDKTIAANDWVNAAISAGLDAVVVTDHNSGEWIEQIQKASEEVFLATKNQLVVYPGIELCVDNSFIHVLVIFDPSIEMKTVQSFITHCGILDIGNTLKQVSTQKLFETISLPEYDVLIVPAHFNKNKGLCKELNINGIREFAKQLPISAIEVRDDNDVQEVINKHRNKAFQELPALITGSDNPGETDGEHSISGLGNKYTWVKLSEHSLEALRQAFVDVSRIKHVFEHRKGEQNPNSVMHPYISGIIINNLKHMDNLDIRLSPHLNCIIGGRGTGKSTIVEMLKMVLKKVINVDGTDKNLIHDVTLETSGVDVFYNFGSDKPYKVTASGKKNRKWVCCDDHGVVEDCPDFPVSIYSQKDIYNLVDDDDDLEKHRESPILSIVDENLQEEKMRIESEINRWIRSSINASNELLDIREEVKDIPKIKGAIEVANSKLKRFEETGILSKKNAFENIAKEHAVFSKVINDVGDATTKTFLQFDNLIQVQVEKISAQAGYECLHSSIMSNIEQIKEVILETKKKFAIYIKNMDSGLMADELTANLNTAKKEYDLAITLLEGIDIEEFHEIEDEYKSNADLLTELIIKKEKEDEIVIELKKSLDSILVQRAELLKRRVEIAKGVNEKAKNIELEIQPYAHKERWISQIRKEMGKTEVFDDEFDALGNWLFSSNGGLLNLENWKAWQWFILTNDQIGVESFTKPNGKIVFSDKFMRMWQGKAQEKTLNSLLTIWPEDKVSIKIVNNGETLAINDGSPGQKSAAILAFVMNQGNNPLIIDQPEDDLDNSLIRELVVNSIRRMKLSRQIIIVTHNPNIPVIGDAEGIIMLDRSASGKVILREGKKTGCIEEPTVKKGICDIMEGGIEAFKWREKKYLNVEK